MGTARLATRSDLGPIARTLAAAFDDDPVLVHLFPPGVRARQRRITGLMGIPARNALGHGTLWTTGDPVAAAIWQAPGHVKDSAVESLRSTPASIRSLRGRILAGFRVLQAVSAVRPREPHWYLETLGTHPDHQGRGLGRALLEPVLERCDAEGTGAYLESSKPENVPYYERFGFTVTGEVTLPDGGPTLPTMWRDPRPRS